MAKSHKPIIKIHNIETDEVIEREMTDSEFAKYEADKAEYLVEQAEAKAKEIAKAAILDRIGLTADELKTILG
jgi:hypothetical protein